MELRITINLDNRAFCDNPAEEVERLLQGYLAEFGEDMPEKYKFIDSNGNGVGEAKVCE